MSNPRVQPTLGHHFGPLLLCAGCGTTWQAQRLEPTQCPRPMGRFGKGTLSTTQDEPASG